MPARPYDSDSLRKDVRDYYGTAMFNGNPMAMMELEEAERASDEDLRSIAQQCGIDPNRYDSPRYGTDPGFGHVSPRPNSGFGVRASVHTEAIGPGATRFFDRSDSQHDSGFFAPYGRALRDTAIRKTLNGNDEHAV